MGLVEKVEGELEVKSAADKLHDVYSRRPHHVSNMIPDKIHGCDLHEGQFGKQGSVVIWTFIHEGEKQWTKELVEEIDDVKNITAFKVIEGDLLKDYKQVKTIIKITPKREGSVVYWIVEYERKTPQTPPPNSLLDNLIDCSKDIDAYLISQL